MIASVLLDCQHPAKLHVDFVRHIVIETPYRLPRKTVRLSYFCTC
jgi:hypothetical protein